LVVWYYIGKLNNSNMKTHTTNKFTVKIYVENGDGDFDPEWSPLTDITTARRWAKEKDGIIYEKHEDGSLTEVR